MSSNVGLPHLVEHGLAFEAGWQTPGLLASFLREQSQPILQGCRLYHATPLLHGKGSLSQPRNGPASGAENAEAVLGSIRRKGALWNWRLDRATHLKKQSSSALFSFAHRIAYILMEPRVR
jgi:hypothetical protein